MISAQAYLDLEPFLPGSPYSLGISFSLTSAPVMFHLEHDPALFEEIDKGVNSIQDVDYVKVNQLISITIYLNKYYNIK